MACWVSLTRSSDFKKGATITIDVNLDQVIRIAPLQLSAPYFSELTYVTGKEESFYETTDQIDDKRIAADEQERVDAGRTADRRA